MTNKCFELILLFEVFLYLTLLILWLFLETLCDFQHYLKYIILDLGFSSKQNASSIFKSILKVGIKVGKCTAESRYH